MLRCHGFGDAGKVAGVSPASRRLRGEAASQNRASPRGVAARIGNAPERGAGSPESGRGAPAVFRGSDLGGDRGRRSFASDSGRIPKLHRVPAPPRQPHRLRGCDRGTGRERVVSGPMRVSGVRSPEGPLFRPTTRHPSMKRLEPAPPCTGRFVARLANIDILAAPRFAPSPILAATHARFIMLGALNVFQESLKCGRRQTRPGARFREVDLNQPTRAPAVHNSVKRGDPEWIR
jgi:hypothetical protein